MNRAAWALCACALAAACDDHDDAIGEPEGTARPADSRAPSPASLFPLSPGDRWRVETEDGSVTHNLGVTGREDRGAAVVHGTGHTVAERYVATDRQVAMVDPDGNVLVPLLRAPLDRGEEWSYTLRDRGVSVPCTAAVRTTGVTERVAGASLEGCVELRRRCSYPEGEPFPRATTHTTDELYCPGVGRVREVTTFDPPPPASVLPARRAERVVGWRVRGAPAMPEPVGFGCESFLLLPSDIQAACGAAVSAVAPASGESGDESCTYRFEAPGGAITVEAERAQAEVDDAALDAALSAGAEEPVLRTEEGVRIATGDDVRLGLSHGRTRVIVTAGPDACPEESALRLAPLLRSLIAR